MRIPLGYRGRRWADFRYLDGYHRSTAEFIWGSGLQYRDLVKGVSTLPQPRNDFTTSGRLTCCCQVIDVGSSGTTGEWWRGIWMFSPMGWSKANIFRTHESYQAGSICFLVCFLFQLPSLVSILDGHSARNSLRTLVENPAYLKPIQHRKTNPEKDEDVRRKEPKT
jgi:hypothetical protein